MHYLHSHLTYNPLQELTAPLVDEDCNVVILAPTSSGKTICAEQFMFPVVDTSAKAMYLSPLKALTQEKLMQWDGLPYSKIAITSDHDRITRSITEDIILMTNESLDSKSRGIKGWLKKIGVLVADESHIISMYRRGDAFEVGLMRFSEQNPAARLILLSATITNAQQLGDWLTILNGKPTKVIETDWRPIIQNYHFVITQNTEMDFDSKLINTISEVRKKHPDSQMLIFVHTIRKGHKLAKVFKCPFHYSKVTKKERREIEAAYMAKQFNTLVATSTLAYGINLPADVGIICGAHRGLAEVEPLDLKQMAGRIGRYGLSKTADVYFVLKSIYADKVQYDLEHIPPVESVLHKRLYFHLVSFRAREDMDEARMKQFLSRSFMALCQPDYEHFIDEGLSLLQQYKILEGPDLKPSTVARGAALMYVDPIDLWHLRKNLSTRPTDAEGIARAFAKIPSNEMDTFMPADIKKDPVDMPFSQQTIIATSLKQWLQGKDLTITAASVVPPMISDIERWIAALGIAGLNKDYLTDLQARLTGGVPVHLLSLVKLPTIGRVRAARLYDKGIKTKDDVLANERIVANIIGALNVKRIKAHLHGNILAP